MTQYTVKTVKHPHNVVVWGAFSGNHGWGCLYFQTKNVTMRGSNYLEVLDQHLLPLWTIHHCNHMQCILRILTNSDYVAHTEPIFKTLGLIKLLDLFTIQIYKLYHKIQNNNVPAYFQNILTPIIPYNSMKIYLSDILDLITNL